MYNFKEKVYNKYNGICAYTGKLLLDDNWEIDHIKPKRQGGTDDFENLLPALKIVNHYKRGYDLEGFRKYMMDFHNRLKRLPKTTKSEKTKKRIIYLQKIAKLFNITEEKGFSGKFYFETYEKIEKRKIKFRGLSISSNWFYGDLLTLPESNYRITRYEDLEFVYSWHANPQTVGQFTSFYDKCGKEIYEGDIVEIEYFKSFFTDDEEKEIIRAEIVFHKGCFGIFYKNIFEPLFFYNENTHIKVVGDIYEQ